MSAILHRRLHGHSSHQSSTSQHHQLRIHQLIKETMASIHDQLQCCLWIPRTNNKHQQHTHTRSKTETDEALSESTQNQGRLFQLIRILQWKINASDKQKLSSASTTHSPKPYSWYQSFEHEYIDAPGKLGLRQAID